MTRRWQSSVVGLIAALIMGGGLLQPDPVAAQSAPPATPPTDARRGLVWDGLVPSLPGFLCEGIFEVRGRASEVLGCTHGPDAAPAGVDVRVPKSAATLAAEAAALPAPEPGPGTNAQGIPCVGDGTSGYRIEAIYAIGGPTSTRPDRYDTIAPLIRSDYAPFVEWIFGASAAETGGVAHLPFVTTATGDGGCEVVVRHEVLTSAGDDTFSNTVSELKARGYNRADRRYMVWMDANVLCGIGHIYRDSQAGQGNANNGHYTAFGRSDTGCWGYAEGHELMHNLGGVQPDAPNATPGFHCSDEYDLMCYDDDGSGPATMQVLCPGRDGRLLDCGHDDYFYAGTPPSGSWLSTHWNTWNSRFVIRQALAGPAPNQAPTVDAGPNASVSLGAAASLDGTVSDDGLPSGTLTTTWSKASGPGTVSFASASSVDTTATFGAAGTYTLALAASDSALSASDTMTVTVADLAAPVTETFTGSFTAKRKSVTHWFTSGSGTITVNHTGPGGKLAQSMTVRVYSPGGALLGEKSGKGTFTLEVSGPAAGSYRLAVSGTKGSYTDKVTHPPA